MTSFQFTVRDKMTTSRLFDERTKKANKLYVLVHTPRYQLLYTGGNLYAYLLVGYGQHTSGTSTLIEAKCEANTAVLERHRDQLTELFDFDPSQYWVDGLTLVASPLPVRSTTPDPESSHVNLLPDRWHYQIHIEVERKNLKRLTVERYSETDANEETWIFRVLSEGETHHKNDGLFRLSCYKASYGTKAIRFYHADPSKSQCQLDEFVRPYEVVSRAREVAESFNQELSWW